MDVLISFTIDGQAEPAGSKKAFPYQLPSGRLAVNVVDANPKAAKWKRKVARAARRVWSGPLLTCPVKVLITFFRTRPKNQMGVHGVKAGAPEFPTTRPDVLKLARAVEDALTGVVWKDDAQIVTETIRKLYGSEPRVVITIAQEAPEHGLYEQRRV